MENGVYYLFFLISLQQMYKIKGKDWFVNLFNESKLDFIKMLLGILNLLFVILECNFYSIEFGLNQLLKQFILDKLI